VDDGSLSDRQLGPYVAVVTRADRGSWKGTIFTREAGAADAASEAASTNSVTRMRFPP
jgi:hypothetical protein